MKKIKRKIFQYTAVFELNENNGYTVTIPILPGLVTEGETFEEAKIMAEDAIKCYIEGLTKLKQEIPLEREIAQIKLTVEV